MRSGRTSPPSPSSEPLVDPPAEEGALAPGSPSLAKRYAAKLLANIGGLATGAVMMSIVPRALGAAEFGLAEFLFAFFTQAVGILDVGTSIGYYAWLSRRPNDASLVRGYLSFALLVGAALALLVGAAFLLRAPAAWLWPGAGPGIVTAACLAAWLVWLQQIAQKTLDAHALTTTGETIILTCKVLGVAVLVGTAFGRVLTIGTYLGYLAGLPLVTTLVLFFALGPVMVGGVRFWRATVDASPNWTQLRSDLHPYVVPLLAYTVITAGAQLVDRVILEHFAGSVQQGIYSLGNRIATLCFVFSAAMTQLLTREFAVAWHRDDRQSLAQLFQRFVPPLYAVSALIAIFVAWHAQEVVLLFAGRDFAQGSAAILILALYPMHQTLGQLTGAVFYATADMRIYARVGILGVALGLPLLWFLVAPAHLGGLHLGSVGLALKMVLIQVAMVNVLLYFVSRSFHLNFGRLLGFQFVSPLACVALAALSSRLAAFMAAGVVPHLALSGLIYGTLAIVAAAAVPAALGINERDAARARSLAMDVLLRIRLQR